MKKLLKIFSFLPFVNRMEKRKYYATGLGTYLINSFFKRILMVNRGDLLVHFTSRVNNPDKILIKGGDFNSASYLSFATSGGCYYQAMNGIHFGEGTIWSYNCSFISSNHDFLDLKTHVKTGPIVIGNNVWIGTNCIILPNIVLGDNVIVGAGSVVTKNFECNSVIGGNPAKVLFMRCKKCGDKITGIKCLTCINNDKK